MSQTFHICEARGNTWPIRENLKKLGFRWDRSKKIWMCFGVSEKDKISFERQLQDRQWLNVQLTFISPVKHQEIF